MGTEHRHKLVNLLRKFQKDEQGVFAVIFGLMAVVLIALGGAVVDYVRLDQSRNRAQAALDSAALAMYDLAVRGTLTESQIRANAQAIVDDSLGKLSVGDEQLVANIESAHIDKANGSLYFEGRLSMPTIFVRLVGVPEMNARFFSEASRDALALEVAFVLDNSGSMSQTGVGTNGSRQRIQFLRDAAKCATNILFYRSVQDDPANTDTCIPAPGTTQVEDVSVGLVPFTMFVNVGANNRDSGWIDRNGTSSIANDNFDNDDDENTLPTSVPSRFDLFSATGETWRGCVEARPSTLDTDDSQPGSGDSLFVPLFSPDMVDGIGRNNYLDDQPATCDRPATTPITTTCTQRQVYSCKGNDCWMQSDTHTPSGPVNFSSNAKMPGGYYGAHAKACSCRSYEDWSSPKEIGNDKGNKYFERIRGCQGGGYVPEGLSNRELQERVCKYYAGVGSTDFSTGPNADCTRTAILPLSDNPAAVLSTISGMTAEGGTNIHEGAAWGMRVLTPAAPFVAKEANDFIAKALVIMTDGENTAYNLSNHCNSTQRSLNGSCYNSAYGFPYNSSNSSGSSTSGGNVERLGKFSPPTHMGAVGVSNSSLVAEMNARTRETCQSAKAANITVYTIGLATSQAEQSSQAEVEDMLTDCATTPNGAFFPQTPGELKEVFQQIAGQLSELRLSK